MCFAPPAPDGMVEVAEKGGAAVSLRRWTVKLGLAGALIVLTGCGGLGDGDTGLASCDEALRLVPTFVYPNSTYDEYSTNRAQYDAICLPEAWHFMRDKWQGPHRGGGVWPIVVVIDDGFFPSDDSGIRPEIRPGYPDGSGLHPAGSAWGHLPPPDQAAGYGHHGTTVLSLMASRVNNGFLLAGACGQWSNMDMENGDRWGVQFLPVRIGRGVAPPPSPSLLDPIFTEVVFSLNQIRVVNLSKTLIEIAEPEGSPLEGRLEWANARQVVVVTGAGNERESIGADRWVRRFDNVIVVGALNTDGTALWIDGPETGTATGPGVDVYAPGEGLQVVEAERSVVTGSGTSYAAPLVSCIAAMMLNVKPSLDPREVRDILVQTADILMLDGGQGTIRRVNARRAIACADVVLRSTTSPIGPGPRVIEWSCDLELAGAYSGRRVQQWG